MTKPIKAWCVFDNDGRPFVDTARPTQEECIKAFDRDWCWKKIRCERGYTCRKVEIREVGDE